MELSTAVKPWLLRHLLEGPGVEAVAYLDPDIRIFDSIEEIDRRAREHGVVLPLPDFTTPLPRDDRKPSEEDILIAGTYNLGFIGLGKGETTDALLDWWSERLENHCLNDPEQGRFVDQRWIDLVPGFWPSISPSCARRPTTSPTGTCRPASWKPTVTATGSTASRSASSTSAVTTRGGPTTSPNTRTGSCCATILRLRESAMPTRPRRSHRASKKSGSGPMAGMSWRTGSGSTARREASIARGWKQGALRLPLDEAGAARLTRYLTATKRKEWRQAVNRYANALGT